MFDSIKNIRTLAYEVNVLERGNHGYIRVRSNIKLNCHPHKLYLINPDKNLEILYDQTKSPDKALVKLPALSFISVMLDPNGSIMRKNQHYTILELGFEIIAKSLALVIAKDPEGIANFNWRGKCVKNNHNCYLIEYNNPKFDYIPYTVGNKETVSYIAGKLLVNEHIVRHKNNLINNFNYLKEGQIIQVPNLYLKRAVLYIDEKTMLPVSISTFDDREMYESYDFNEVVINKHFSTEDFDRNNKNYHF